MTTIASPRTFFPRQADAAGVISWVHLGDLHMTRSGEQNDLDLQAMVVKINRAFADSVSFVYLPGDVADDGSRAAYKVVRQSLDQLVVPWCAIIGDHDVHEKSFANFREAMSDHTHYAFTVGDVRFLAMNAFDVPEPSSFTVADGQLRWVKDELQKATAAGETKVLLLHCYPSDLKAGGDALSRLMREYDVRMVDMGHTHYNEVANNGQCLYTATRSTGQIEEGPVGFSVTSLDGRNWSWRFIEATEATSVVITSPADMRLTTMQEPCSGAELAVRVKVWSETPVIAVEAAMEASRSRLTQIAGSQVWEGTLNTTSVTNGLHALRVTARTADGTKAEDEIRVAFGMSPSARRLARDQDNEIGAWPERGLLGTQLGPNKNGKKW